MTDFQPETAVWHDVYGYGTFRKLHKNGRASVQFDGLLLPKTVDIDSIRLWSEVLTGSDYE